MSNDERLFYTRAVLEEDANIAEALTLVPPEHRDHVLNIAVLAYHIGGLNALDGVMRRLDDQRAARIAKEGH